MAQHRAFALFLRFTAAVLFIAATVLVILPPEIAMKDWRLVAWMGFLIALGAVLSLLGLASLISRESKAPPEVAATLNRLEQQILELKVKLNDLYLISDRASRSASPASPPPPVKDYTRQFEQLAAAIEEVREISMLPDAERRQRILLHRQQRKASQIKELFDLVAAHEWSRAERLLISLETEFPNDHEVAKGRNYLDHSRRLFEQETVQKTIGEVEALMSSSAWEQALDRARQLVQGFPHNGDATALLSRVEREYATFQESTVQRMFEEIRHDIDRRLWRRAFMHATRLIQQFPEHRLAEQLRGQIKTLQDNAEIEERQEIEVRIQELMRAHEFEQAIELAEDLIRRYPLSPQAESLETLLPRMRELARQGADQFASITPQDIQPTGTPPAGP
ncbi:hypothetical protein [Fontivita pretiosa]|uniref:hypothetical protein n=1 Tax=Fontivita pretiosa TaxID=2989684 RepID=UPI003D180CD8